MRTITIACLALLLATACSARFKERGAEVMDKILADAEWVMCRAASVGSVQRRYGQSIELAEAYQKLCLEPDKIMVVPHATIGTPADG